MCGIAGIFHPGRSRPPGRMETVARAMLRAMDYRGPDHLGCWADDRFAAGTVRLSITGGGRRANQPLVDEQGGVFVFNGELYDPAEVARRMGSEYDPEDSDGTVLARLVRDRGPGGLRGISAMFALARHDPRDGSLLLARDAYGQKPLYHRTLGDGTLVFGSTIAAVHAAGGPLRVREAAIDECLLFKSVGGCATGFEEVEQLPPGGWLRIDRDGVATRGIWNEFPDPGSAPDPSPEEIREAILEAIRKRLNPRFRPTVFLSGGLDSSMVTAGVCRSPLGELEPLALSIGYDVGTSEDETDHARRLTRELGIPHEVVMLRAAEVPDLMERVSGFLEDPVADPITIPFFHIAGVAAAETKVVLTGDGADEFWGGYDRFADPPDSVDEYLPRSMVFKPEEIGRESYPPSYLAGVPLEDRLRPLDRIMRMEVRNRLRNYHLARIDKLSMAHGLEARCPFLDATVSRMAMQIPGSLKRDGSRVKIPLLEASENLLPRWLLDRRKQPFTGPVLGWLRSSLRPRLLDLAHGADPRLSARVAIPTLIDSLDRPEAAGGIANRLWTLLVLETWLGSTAPRFSTTPPERLDAS
ncbi:MAG: hypothetical protein CMJ52_02425 [Planctomycetaceae bacterium]|nr:hypothetical protein [Planctomycetaceae bacterium]